MNGDNDNKQTKSQGQMLADSFTLLLGSGRGRRPFISNNQVSEIIEEMNKSGETLNAERAIARQNISETNRQILKQSLGASRYQKQKNQIIAVANLSGLLPRVDSQGLINLSDKKMHRWAGHWHSGESLLMASNQLSSQTKCGQEIAGGDSKWQPLTIDQWQKKAENRCPDCGNNDQAALDYITRLEKIEETFSKILQNKNWPEASDFLTVRSDSWEIIRARVLHPLDCEEIDKERYSNKQMALAWKQLLTHVVAQRPVSYQAAASLALDSLAVIEREGL